MNGSDSSEQERSIYLNDKQYYDALIRFQEYIKSGGELWKYDSTTIGDKNTECSWGLCCQSVNMWPEDTRVFDGRTLPGPIVGQEDRRIVQVKYLGDNHHCPFDRRLGGNEPNTFGCFYHCRIFRPDRPMTEERALELYQVAIDRLSLQ